MKINVFGLSITSSWGNGHATTYRALVRALAARGHRLVFYERRASWYADNCDLPNPPYCRMVLYDSVAELASRADPDLCTADVSIVGSYVPEGIAVGDLVLRAASGLVAFYDIDTPVTLARLSSEGTEYIAARQIPRYHLYLSFTGGPTLEALQRTYGSPMARPLYCSVDPELYFPEPTPVRWDLGYLGTYSADRQLALDRLLLRVARTWPSARAVVAGAQYPDSIAWPANVDRIVHLAPAGHRGFYNSLRYTVNVTRADMLKAGYSPSVRLFEAAACGTPIISDAWRGLEEFFRPGKEILLASTAGETLAHLRRLGEEGRRTIAAAARERVLTAHTAGHRAVEFEAYVTEAGLRPAAEAAS
jgi:spore maturation protein CgeB